MTIEIHNKDGLEFLKSVDKNSIDLILTDPPYIISRETGMNAHYNKVKENEQNNVKFAKTEKDWEKYKKANPDISYDEKTKENYLKYGSIYGKKYCVKTDYGDWDSKFTLEILEQFIEQFYIKLRSGGTLIIFFDLWKIETLKNILEKL